MRHRKPSETSYLIEPQEDTTEPQEAAPSPKQERDYLDGIVRGAAILVILTALALLAIWIYTMNVPVLKRW